MPAVLSAAGERVIAMMPHYYAEDPAVAAVIDPLAKELERLEAFFSLITTQWFPQNAADDYGQLGIREQQLGIPVEPLGISIEQRRNIVHAYERARISGSGEDWKILLTIALGATVWTHKENTPGNYDLRITVPYAEGSFTTAQVEALADAISPAHLNLAMQFEQGFVVGVSRVGDVI